MGDCRSTVFKVCKIYVKFNKPLGHSSEDMEKATGPIRLFLGEVGWEVETWSQPCVDSTQRYGAR
jgi:hypothetical protein